MAIIIKKDSQGIFHRTSREYDTGKSDEFSPADRRITEMALIKNRCHKSYLGIPSGKFKVNSTKGDYEL